MTTGSMSALEGDGLSLGGIVQANWYYFFNQKAEGADVFDSPIYFALPSAGVFSATEDADTISSSGDITAQGSLSANEAGEDEFSSSGVAFLSGELAASEAGSDTMVSTGVVPVQGTLSASESSDTFSATGKEPAPVAISQGGHQRQELEWQPWPLLADEVIRKAKRKRNDVLMLLH